MNKIIKDESSRNNNFTSREDNDKHPYLPKLGSKKHDKENKIKINIENAPGHKIKEVKIV